MYSIEEFDREKTKVFKYIIYKKRTEYEVRTKFSRTIEEGLLDDIILYLKDAGYLDDHYYVERTINEFMALKYMSIKEMKYKLQAKGLKRNIIDEYFELHDEEIKEYEEKSAVHQAVKKLNTLSIDEIKIMLMKKGYKESSIKEAISKVEE